MTQPAIPSTPNPNTESCSQDKPGAEVSNRAAIAGSTPNPELEAALDEYADALSDLDDWEPEMSGTWEYRRSALDDTRAALVSLYTRLQQERDFYRAGMSEMKAYVAEVSRLSSKLSRIREVNANLVEANRDRIAEFTAAFEELSRVKETALTQEEARWILDGKYDIGCCICPTSAKIRRKLWSSVPTREGEK